MLAKHFSSIRNYLLSVFSQRKYNFYYQNMLLDAFLSNSRNIIGRNPSMVIPFLANQDLTPMLMQPGIYIVCSDVVYRHIQIFLVTSAQAGSLSGGIAGMSLVEVTQQTISSTNSGACDNYFTLF